MTIEDNNLKRYEFNRKKQNSNVKNNKRNDSNIILDLPYHFLANSLDKIIKNKSNNLRLLDYCCGTGIHSDFALKKGIECWGIDISEDSIVEAKDLASKYNEEFKYNYTVGNAEKLPYEDNKFDIIISCGSISYLDFEISMMELKRVLKSNGKLIILDTTKNNIILNIKRYIKYIFSDVSKYHIENLFDNKKIKLLTNDLFYLEEIKYFHLLSIIGLLLPNNKITDYFNDFLMNIDEYLSNTFMKKYFWKFCCVLTNKKHKINCG